MNGVQAKVGRILGIDIGEKRIGIAISSPEGGLAIPLRIIESAGANADAEAIAHIAIEERVETLVLGHPLSMDGSVGPQARRIEQFAQTLQRVIDLPVVMQDERLSTAQARRSFASSKHRKPVDDVAASVVLQAYLDQLRLQNETRGE